MISQSGAKSKKNPKKRAEFQKYSLIFDEMMIK